VKLIVLGIHKNPWHNTGAAMIKSVDGGKVEFAFISEERLDRIKDSRSFPILSIKSCMEKLGVENSIDIDLVVMDYIENKDWRRDNKQGDMEVHEFMTEIPDEKIITINHHLAHAYSVFYSSGFSESAILVVDGRGSQKETQSLYNADSYGNIHLIEKTENIGIGLLYSSVTQMIGFKLLQEGKTMGLAPYGVDKKILNLKQDYNGISTNYSHMLETGKYTFVNQSSLDLSKFQEKANVAFEVQQECESAMLHLARHAKVKTKSTKLCITGGVALNSVANYKVLQSGVFDDIFINPACSDSGIPLGCVLYGFHHHFNHPRDYSLISPFIGNSYSDRDRLSAINAYSGYSVIEDVSFEYTVSLLSENKIVACHQGASEMGPRALGNRSILMSPIFAENKNILNLRVKHREDFRPFAPACLEEYAQEYFEIDRPSPFMLFVPNVKAEKKHLLPAVTHVDSTGRLQTLTSTRNQHFYKIVQQFYKKTGVPVLLNTSFNVAGEPIVETPENAIECFLGTDIDALILGKFLLIKKVPK